MYACGLVGYNIYAANTISTSYSIGATVTGTSGNGGNGGVGGAGGAPGSVGIGGTG